MNHVLFLSANLFQNQIIIVYRKMKFSLTGMNSSLVEHKHKDFTEVERIQQQSKDLMRKVETRHYFLENQISRNTNKNLLLILTSKTKAKAAPSKDKKFDRDTYHNEEYQKDPIQDSMPNVNMGMIQDKEEDAAHHHGPHEALEPGQQTCAMKREQKQRFQKILMKQFENIYKKTTQETGENNASIIAARMVEGTDLERISYTQFEQLLNVPGVVDQICFQMCEALDQKEKEQAQIQAAQDKINKPMYDRKTYPLTKVQKQNIIRELVAQRDRPLFLKLTNGTNTYTQTKARLDESYRGTKYTVLDDIKGGLSEKILAGFKSELDFKLVYNKKPDEEVTNDEILDPNSYFKTFRCRKSVNNIYNKKRVKAKKPPHTFGQDHIRESKSAGELTQKQLSNIVNYQTNDKKENDLMLQVIVQVAGKLNHRMKRSLNSKKTEMEIRTQVNTILYNKGSLISLHKITYMSQEIKKYVEQEEQAKNAKQPEKQSHLDIKSHLSPLSKDQSPQRHSSQGKNGRIQSRTFDEMRSVTSPVISKNQGSRTTMIRSRIDDENKLYQSLKFLKKLELDGEWVIWNPQHKEVFKNIEKHNLKQHRIYYKLEKDEPEFGTEARKPRPNELIREEKMIGKYGTMAFTKNAQEIYLSPNPRGEIDRQLTNMMLAKTKKDDELDAFLLGSGRILSDRDRQKNNFRRNLQKFETKILQMKRKNSLEDIQESRNLKEQNLGQFASGQHYNTYQQQLTTVASDASKEQRIQKRIKAIEINQNILPNRYASIKHEITLEKEHLPRSQIKTVLKGSDPSSSIDEARQEMVLSNQEMQMDTNFDSSFKLVDVVPQQESALNIKNFNQLSQFVPSDREDQDVNIPTKVSTKGSPKYKSESAIATPKQSQDNLKVIQNSTLYRKKDDKSVDSDEEQKIEVIVDYQANLGLTQSKKFLRQYGVEIDGNQDDQISDIITLQKPSVRQFEGAGDLLSSNKTSFKNLNKFSKTRETSQTYMPTSEPKQQEIQGSLNQSGEFNFMKIKSVYMPTESKGRSSENFSKTETISKTTKDVKQTRELSIMKLPKEQKSSDFLDIFKKNLDLKNPSKEALEYLYGDEDLFKGANKEFLKRTFNELGDGKLLSIQTKNPVKKKYQLPEDQLKKEYSLELKVSNLLNTFNIQNQIEKSQQEDLVLEDKSAISSRSSPHIVSSLLEKRNSASNNISQVKGQINKNLKIVSSRRGQSAYPSQRSKMTGKFEKTMYLAASSKLLQAKTQENFRNMSSQVSRSHEGSSMNSPKVNDDIRNMLIEDKSPLNFQPAQHYQTTVSKKGFKNRILTARQRQDGLKNLQSTDTHSLNLINMQSCNQLSFRTGLKLNAIPSHSLLTQTQVSHKTLNLKSLGTANNGSKLMLSNKNVVNRSNAFPTRKQHLGPQRNQSVNMKNMYIRKINSEHKHRFQTNQQKLVTEGQALEHTISKEQMSEIQFGWQSSTSPHRFRLEAGLRSSINENIQNVADEEVLNLNPQAQHVVITTNPPQENNPTHLIMNAHKEKESFENLSKETGFETNRPNLSYVKYSTKRLLFNRAKKQDTSRPTKPNSKKKDGTTAMSSVSKETRMLASLKSMSSRTSLLRSSNRTKINSPTNQGKKSIVQSQPMFNERITNNNLTQQHTISGVMLKDEHKVPGRLVNFLQSNRIPVKNEAAKEVKFVGSRSQISDLQLKSFRKKTQMPQSFILKKDQGVSPMLTPVEQSRMDINNTSCSLVVKGSQLQSMPNRFSDLNSAFELYNKSNQESQNKISQNHYMIQGMNIDDEQLQQENTIEFQKKNIRSANQSITQNKNRVNTQIRRTDNAMQTMPSNEDLKSQKGSQAHQIALSQDKIQAHSQSAQLIGNLMGQRDSHSETGEILNITTTPHLNKDIKTPQAADVEYLAKTMFNNEIMGIMPVLKEQEGQQRMKDFELNNYQLRNRGKLKYNTNAAEVASPKLSINQKNKLNIQNFEFIDSYTKKSEPTLPPPKRVQSGKHKQVFSRLSSKVIHSQLSKSRPQEATNIDLKLKREILQK